MHSGAEEVGLLEHTDLEWLFHVKIRFRLALPDSERLTFKNSCVKRNKRALIGTKWQNQ